MTEILIHPVELRETSSQLQCHAQKLGQSLGMVDSLIRSMKGQSFLGHRSDMLQMHYGSRRDALLCVMDVVLRFAAELNSTADIFEKADQSSSSALPLPVAAGHILPMDWVLPILPLFPQALKPRFNWPVHRILPLDPGFGGIKGFSVPDWLKKKLDQIFPPPDTISPVSQSRDTDLSLDPGTSFGDLLKQSPVPGTTEIGQTSSSDISHNVPNLSQGNLYGSAACAPTSVSMILDYYHSQDNAHQTLSPEQLIARLDPGDGTPGRGMSLSNLTDELNDLGYHHISQKVDASFADLISTVQDGPVIVTTGVKLTGPGTINANEPRALNGPGNTIHAVVVTGISDAVVMVNDPWTGSQLELSKEDFETMWSRGSNAYYSIRP